jgi:hypothetical protein
LPLKKRIEKPDGSFGGRQDTHPTGGVQLLGYLSQVGGVGPDDDRLIGKQVGALMISSEDNGSIITPI